MRRLIAAAALVAGLATFVVVGTGAGSDAPAGYQVRAIFDDAPLNAGADVVIAGVIVGKVASLDVTPEHKAALTLTITNHDFVPFRRDARCGTRLQSLIGERTVTCLPGTSKARPLPRIEKGPGHGTYLLPVQRTYGSVDLDLVNAIARKPANQQLSVLLSELGAGFATRGPELAEIIRRANPGLETTDQLVRVLAAQRRQLASLATDGDRVLRPLAKKRQELVGFLRASQRSAGVAVDHRAAFAAGVQKLPAMLRSLTPLMAQLNAFAERSTPVFANLSTGAPALSRATQSITPFARQSVPTLERLAKSTQLQSRQVPRTVTLARKLTGLGRDLTVPSTQLSQLLHSLEAGNGIPNLLATFYGAANATNGFDATSHYVRAEGLSGSCGQYTSVQFFGCDAQFGAAKIGDTPETGSARATSRATPAARVSQPSPKAAAPATPLFTKAAAPEAVNGVLDYLLGNDG